VVHDVGTNDGQPFIVMELLHGSEDPGSVSMLVVIIGCGRAL